MRMVVVVRHHRVGMRALGSQRCHLALTEKIIEMSEFRDLRPQIQIRSNPKSPTANLRLDSLLWLAAEAAAAACMAAAAMAAAWACPARECWPVELAAAAAAMATLPAAIACSQPVVVAAAAIASEVGIL